MSDSATQFYPGLPQQPTSPSETPGTRPTVSAPAAVRPRIWPGVIIVSLMWLAMFGPGWVPALQGTRFQVNAMLLGSMVGAVCVGLWWLFASRVPWTDRLLILLFFATSAFAVIALADKSFIYMNYGPIIRGLPLGTAALVVWLLITPGLNWPVRRLGTAIAILLAWGYCDLVRLDGVWGDFQPQVSWRWETKSELLYMAGLADRKTEAPTTVKTALAVQPGDWTGFRGPNRDGRLTGVRIETDWKSNPPKQLWKQRIGPGWSSFAVVGDRVFTQEQRGDSEAVVCFDANTGAELWAHLDPTRFYEEIGGAGPRSTPTYAEEKLFTLGANGKLNCLEPATGKVVWTRDIAADSGAKVPKWGFSSSPLVVQGVVTVFAGGKDGKGVLGYHSSSGELAWSGGDGTNSYSSTQLEHLAGVDQLAIAHELGLTALNPTDGTVLWKHGWDMGDQGARTAQPMPIGDSDLLLGTPMKGMRRIHLAKDGEKWVETQLWETKDIRPYYNDLVVYKDHAYGFDNNFFTCVNLEDGKGTWRARGYGNGQVVLLADQGLLLISTEKGEIALVEATPDAHKEVARIKAIEGKTWNHPVVANGKLFVRNGDEVACFQLPLKKDKVAATK